MGRKKKEQPTKQCRVCGELFSKPPHKSFDIWNTMVCCSKICGATKPNSNGSYMPAIKYCQYKGCKQPFLKGKKDTYEHFARQMYCCISCGKMGKRKGKLNNKWLGDQVSYRGIHLYITQNFGKPEFCEHCKTSERRMYHWANISGEHKRDRNDWLRLCVPCHKKFDLTSKIQL